MSSGMARVAGCTPRGERARPQTNKNSDGDETTATPVISTRLGPPEAPRRAPAGALRRPGMVRGCWNAAVSRSPCDRKALRF